MPIKPYSARHTTEDLGTTLQITIPSQKQWFQIIFLCVWLTGWLVGEITVSGALLIGNPSGPPVPFLLVWLLGWTLGGAYSLYMLSWLLFGKEIIAVSAQSLITKRVVLGLGFPKEYSAEYVRALRISATANAQSMSSWTRTNAFYGMSGGWIAFDYGAKTIHFGAGIDEAEAKQILAEIGRRFPQYHK
jgi:hypothetical protein